jgi:hypothetical protein
MRSAQRAGGPSAREQAPRQRRLQGQGAHSESSTRGRRRPATGHSQLRGRLRGGWCTRAGSLWLWLSVWCLPRRPAHARAPCRHGRPPATAQRPAGKQPWERAAAADSPPRRPSPPAARQPATACRVRLRQNQAKALRRPPRTMAELSNAKSGSSHAKDSSRAAFISPSGAISTGASRGGADAVCISHGTAPSSPGLRCTQQRQRLNTSSADVCPLRVPATCARYVRSYAEPWPMTTVPKTRGR